MASRIFTVNFSLIIIWILRMISVKSIMYFEHTFTDNSGLRYIPLRYVNVTLTSDLTLMLFDHDCTKTLSFRPPNEEEKQNRRGYREGSSVCRSWRHPIPGQRRRSEDLFELF
ncbi:hypothetical protein KSF78_0004968 [Schistosoma japonicum]|nr:hypothetical protein KSF78_0004968 [Schistosoma japonicum]